MVKFGQKTLVMLLLVLLVLALAYIVFDKYMDYQEQQKFEVYQEGMQYGYQQAIIQVMQQLATCQPVPLYAGNATINAVAVECLQMQQDQVSSTLGG
jgi:choline-glycine betaine transporter